MTLSAFAATKASFVYDKSFKLKNKKFSFSGVAEEDRKIHKMLSDSTGGVILVGSFTKYASFSQRYIVRLSSNLTIDASFLPQVNGEILDVAISPDGGIFIGGDFTTVDGLSRIGIAKLLSTGAIDPSFDPGIGANGSIQNVTAVMPFSDNSVAIFGSFSRVAGRSATYSIAKLLPTGALDNTFLDNLHTATLSDGVRSITSTDVCEKMPGDSLLVLGFGSNTESSSPDGFEGSAVINSDGTRTGGINDASAFVTSYKHARGSSAASGIGYGFISHELFSNTFKPIHETIYRFDATGAIDPAFKIRKKEYLTAAALTGSGKFLIAPQTVKIKTVKNKTRYSAKSVLERYGTSGSLETRLALPAIKDTAFEYRNLLELSDGTILVHIRTIKVSKKVGTGRAFSHYLVKVKKK